MKKILIVFFIAIISVLLAKTIRHPNRRRHNIQQLRPLASPIVLEEFIYLNATPNAHASTIVELYGNNTFAAAWFGGKGEGSDDTKIYMATKQGVFGDWSEPFVVASHAPQACWNPVLYWNGTDLILFYKSGPHAYNWSGFIKRSRDGGKTWSDDQLLPGGIVGPAKNKPLLIKRQVRDSATGQVVDKSILMTPSSLETHFRDSSYMDITEDWGLSWRKVGPIYLIQYDMVQPTIFFVDHVDEMSTVNKSTSAGDLQQNLRAIIRSDSKRLVTTTSSDYGNSWSTPVLTNIPNPHSGVDAVRLANGKIILINNDRETIRNPINVWLSLDQGKSFKNVYTLDSDPKCEGFSYPAVIQASNGLVHITYTWICRHLSQNVRIKHVVLDPSKL